jgi:hypothetical protein
VLLVVPTSYKGGVKGKRVKFKEEINICVREMEALRDNRGEAES